MAACAIALALPAAAAGSDFVPYVSLHNLSSADLTTTAQRLADKNYRLTDVSGYATGFKLRYAALWQKVGGPTQKELHGLSLAEFKAQDSTLKHHGFRPVFIAGYEVNGSDQYAGIWEKASGPKRVDLPEMTAAEYQSRFDHLTAQGYRLIQVNGYVKGGAPRYAAIFEKSSGPPGITHPEMTLSDLIQTTKDLADQGYRLKLVSGYHESAGNRYAAIWEQESGPTMRWRFGTRLVDYQRNSDVDHYQGFQPIYTQAFTFGLTGRFNTIEISRFSQADLDTIKNAFDAVLAKQHIAGLSVAIAKNDKLLYAGGFGLADKENHIPMNVDHRLRIGSISKTITSVAMYKLLEEGKLNDPNHHHSGLSRRVFGPGGVLSPIQVPASMSSLKHASVRNFLEHTSGLPGASSPNPLRDPVHCAAGNLSKRLEWELARHAAQSASDGYPALLGNPGQYYDYSNFDHNILQRVIETLSGTTYQNYVRQHVLEPAGVTAARLFTIGPYDPSSGEAKHYDAAGNYAEYYPSETCDNQPPGTGAGGWAMSAKDLLQYFVSVDSNYSRNIIDNFDQFDMITEDPPTNEPPSNYAKSWIINGWGWCGQGVTIIQGHNGGLRGAFSDLFSLPNGFSFALIANQETGTGQCTSPSGQIDCGGAAQPYCGDDTVVTLLKLLGDVTWPNHDLFPAAN